ncbi:MAG: hypothetical protein ACOC05_08395, partial [Oceanicaulis sp.]
LARRFGAPFERAREAFADWPGAPGHGRIAAYLKDAPLIDWSAARTPQDAVDAACAAPARWIAGPGLDKRAADLLAEKTTRPVCIHLAGDRGGAARRLARLAPVKAERDLDAALARALVLSAEDGYPVVYAPGSVLGQTGDGLGAAFRRLSGRALPGDAA